MTMKPEHAGEPLIAFELILKHPFTTAGGERIEKLSVRRGRRGDLRAANQYSRDEVEQETFLFARLAGLTMEDIDALDMEDNAELLRRFRGLLGNPPAQP